jgi:hypothetical protein
LATGLAAVFGDAVFGAGLAAAAFAAGFAAPFAGAFDAVFVFALVTMTSP